MKRRTRYLLILLGFIFFLITAPLIVLYVSGVTYDFSQNKHVKTGILIANTQPKDVRLLIDGVAKGSTPKRVKFLKPGQHNLTLEKDGYHTWTKNLEIKPEKTTWAAAGVDTVYLLKTELEPNTIATKVLDFVLTNKTLLYLTESQLVLSHGESENQVILLPQEASEISISESQNYALIKGPNTALIVELNTQKAFDISKLTEGHTQLSFTATDQLLELSDNILSKVNWSDGLKTELANNVTSFAYSATDIYVLQKNTASTQNLLVFSANQNIKQAQLLNNNLQLFPEQRLLATRTKELFLLSNSTLYKINSQLNHLADGITSWDYNQSSNSLLLFSAAELNYYDFNSASVNLISRSSSPFVAPALASQIGYTFYGQTGQLHAIELDRRDIQNNFTLADFSNIRKITTADNDQLLYILHEDTLTKLTIR